jgi:outer membrane murein-binding lipoprotein Lpp
MKVLAAILLCIICSSCTDTDSKTNELNQRVTHLEQRVDSLTNTKTEISGDYTNKGTNNENGRCKGITKKGAQCKRKAKNNGYCWQHGR